MMEQNFQTSNTKNPTMKSVTIMNPIKKQMIALDEQQKSNEPNDFYFRCVSQNLSHAYVSILQSLPDATCWLRVDPPSVRCLFSRVRSNKCSEGLPAYLLKNCAEELTPAWCPIFPRSLDIHTVAALWKKSIITPVLKKLNVEVNNDFRPVALMSILMKCFEKFVVSPLKKKVEPMLDTCQFV